MPKARECPPGTSWCATHKDFLPVAMFHKSKKNKSGYSEYCKEHQKERNKKYYFKKREKYLVKYRERAKRSQRKYRGTVEYELRKRIYSSRIRAKELGLEHNLDIEYLMNIYKEQGGRCSVTGRKLKFSEYKEGTNHNGLGPESEDNLSLDRIDPSKGYIKGNVRLVIWAVNVAMNNLGLGNFINLCKDIIKISRK